MPRFHFVGKPPRCFGDNLKRARYCIKYKMIVAEPVVIEISHKVVGKNNVVANVNKMRPRI